MAGVNLEDCRFFGKLWNFVLDFETFASLFMLKISLKKKQKKYKTNNSLPLKSDKSNLYRFIYHLSF